MTIRIIVADDHPPVRVGITMLLHAESDFEVLAEAPDGQQAVDLARTHRPDLVLMDARMPIVDGVTATRLITAQSAGPNHLTKVLMLTTFNDDEVVYGALRAGASGFLLKHAAPKDLAAAVRAVAGGEIWIDHAVAGKVIAALTALPAPDDSTSQVLDRLTHRERDVLILLAQGHSSLEIEDRLGLSDATVKTHISRILIKTGSADRTQAALFAYQSGLVPPPTTGRFSRWNP